MWQLTRVEEHLRVSRQRRRSGAVDSSRRMRFCCIILLLLSPTSLFAAEVKGIPSILDADTVRIGAVKIRLSGIDAPETDQICLNANEQLTTCGVVARDRLQTYSGDRDVGV